MTGSEGQLQLLIDAIPSLVWTARPDGFCPFLNQRWLDFTGMTAEQAQGWDWAAAISAVSAAPRLGRSRRSRTLQWWLW